MCGILGILSYSQPVSLDRLIKARDLLAARGPDDSGVWHNAEDRVGFGHRRLAILDLSPAGHQPMVFANGRYVIVFNGEIYNYLQVRAQLRPPPGGWTSNSDTEVILAAYAKWGKSCLDLFQGMFAFAIWDRHERVLFAARDRMGVKPFYYSINGNAFSFASRPRALKLLDSSINLDLDEQALRWYLDVGYIPAPASMHSAIRKLPAGHHLTLDGSSLRIERYWDYCHIEPDESLRRRSQSDLTDELEELLTTAVRDRLISDVPVGAFLSGGVDSSIVAGLMARVSSQPIKTFTIGFDDQKFDESAYAREASQRLNTIHTSEILTTDDLLKLLPVYTQEYDEPLSDSSAFPVLAVSRLAAGHLPVVLTGDGADEFFGGYHYYQIAQQLARFRRLPLGLRNLFAAVTGQVPLHRAKLLAGAMRLTNGASAYVYTRGIAKDFDSVLSRDVLARTIGMEALVSDVWNRCPPSIDAAEAAMRADANLTLQDGYLQKVDVGSMAFSLEARQPFLDYRLIEWTMRLPIDWKIRGGVRKYLLKQVGYRIFPNNFIDRPKMGFSVPLARWLRGSLRSWAEERIEDTKLFEHGLFDQSKVRSLFHMHLSGARDVHPLLWSILMYLQFLDTARKA